MAHSDTEPFVLHTDDWMDSPQGILAAMLARGDGDIVIDAAAADSLPAQLAQLLLSARRTVVARGRRLRIERPSDALRQNLLALGLGDLLEEAQA